MVLCIQNSDFSIRISSLYGSQPSFVAFACKTSNLGPELQVSMGPRPHLLFFVCETAPLALEMKVSIGPSSHLWFLHEKQRLVAQNYKSQGFQTSPVVLCMKNIVISTRITSVHWSQTSPVVLFMQNNVISIRTTCLYGSQPSSVVFAYKTASFGLEL